MNRDLHMPYSTVSFRMTLSEASHGLSVTAVLLVLVRLLGEHYFTHYYYYYYSIIINVKVIVTLLQKMLQGHCTLYSWSP